jgi:large subunit ribosomal protein L9e
MRTINANQSVKIPDGIDVTVNKRIIVVKGPRGSLERNFKHLAVDIYMKGPRLLTVEKWFGTKKELAAVRTICTHVENMIKGVTKVSECTKLIYVKKYIFFYFFFVLLGFLV